MKSQRDTRSLNDKGFTIIELMIASLVFSVVLVLLTTGFIQVSKLFYKGVTSSKTQEAAREIVDDIGRTIQFNGGSVSPITASGTKYYFCVDNTRYTFVVNQKLLADSSGHVLLKDKVSGGCSGAADLNAAAPDSTELMQPNMRIVNLDITNPSDGLYKIDLRIAYGDTDLLVDTTSPSDGIPDTCRTSNSGGQFCAVSELTTTVAKRI